MNTGDVLLLEDGRMVRILEKDSGIEHIREGRVQFADYWPETYLDIETLEVEANLGSSPEVVASFYSAWSIHKALNRIEL